MDPILVVADNDAIRRLAPVWARAFAAAGRLHRVRLAGSPSEREIDRVAAEATSLAAVEIMGAGGAASQAIAAAVAARLGLSLARADDAGEG